MQIQQQIIDLKDSATAIIWLQTEEINRGVKLIADTITAHNQTRAQKGAPPVSLFDWQIETGAFAHTEKDGVTVHTPALFFDLPDPFNPEAPPKKTNKTENRTEWAAGLHLHTPPNAVVILANPGAFLETLEANAHQKAAVNAWLYAMTETITPSDPRRRGAAPYHTNNATLSHKGTTLIAVGPKPAAGVLDPTVENNIIWLNLERPTREEIKEQILGILNTAKLEKATNSPNPETAKKAQNKVKFNNDVIEASRNIVKNEDGTLPTWDETAALLAENLVGLTLFQSESAIYSTMAAGRVLTPTALNAHRRHLINSAAGLTLQDYDPEFQMNRVIGLDRADEIIRKLMGRHLPARDRARSILLIGPPGCGKTMLGRAFAQRLKIPFVEVHIDKMLAGLVGESERNLNRALQVIDSIGACIAFFDEAEKQLAGASGETGRANDFTQRLGGILLRWEQDRKSDAIIFKTANRPRNFSSEMLRRCDIIINIDFPAAAERETILKMYAGDRNLAIPEKHIAEIIEKTVFWSPDEIKRLVLKIQAFSFNKNGKLEVYPESIEKAFEYIKPVCQAKAEDVKHIRAEAAKLGVRASSAPPIDEEVAEHPVKLNEAIS